ncbi:MAG TPA: TRAP transporter small permease [Cytophagales bacterium]|jgi:TRAP-type C4-dicarboxylate transport system permease small subunit|nr:TRAP transporter small permease [Cytophagales bacterium]
MRKYIDLALEKVLIALMAIMTINVIWQVATRYLTFIFENPSSYTEELARFMLIWVGLLGAAYATGKRLHLAIDLIKSPALDKIIQVLVFLFSLSALVIGGSRLVFISFHLGQTSSALQIPLGYVYIIIPISGVIICLYSIMNFLQNERRSA